MRLTMMTIARRLLPFCLALGLVAWSAPPAVAAVERLSLFVFDGASAHEDRRAPAVEGDLSPLGLDVRFAEATPQAGSQVWSWTLKNVGGAPLTGLRVTVFLDADQSAPDNTFFNETGALLALAAPAGHIAADRWEIAEPGYWSGDLLPRAAEGDLLNRVAPDLSAADDVAMALSLVIEELSPGRSAIVTASLGDAGNAGLRQLDQADGSGLVFQAYALLNELDAPGSPAADLNILKTAVPTAVQAGEAVEYQIVARNAGPDDAAVTIADHVPGAIGNVSWTCAATGGAVCGTGSGMGSDAVVDGHLPVGGELLLTMTGTALSAGTIDNSATVAAASPGIVDPEPADNASIASVTVGAASATADLHVTKTASTPTAGVGDTIEYRIVAGNDGPDPVDGARLLDMVPASLGNVAWTCSGTGGASCGASSGSGNSVDLGSVSLPVGGTVAITVSGRAGESGMVANRSEILPPVGTSDPNPANNAGSASVNVAAAGTVLGIPAASRGALALLALLLSAVAGLALGGRGGVRRASCLLLALGALSAAAPDARALFENGDFESESFEHWTPLSSANPGLSGMPPFTVDNIQFSGANGTRLRAIASRIFDPRAGHLTLPRQGNFSAKVNDEAGGAHLNAVSQRGVISEADRDPMDGKLHVRFSYAAVLDDPSHSPQQQPYFHVQLKDRTSNAVLYDDFAYSGQPGRLFYTTVYQNRTWRSTPFIDVDMEVPDTSLGHEIEVRVLAADCSLGGHGGYVYVDAFGAFRIPPQGACLSGLKVRGKPGQVQLTWPDIGAAAYAVYRSEAFEGPYVRVAVTESRYATWLDTGVTALKPYYYRVHPLDAEGNETCASGEIVGFAPQGWRTGHPMKRPPRFVSDPVVRGDVRDRYDYQPAVEPGDSRALTFSLRHGPLGMVVDPATGKLEWQPSAAGPYQVNLQAEDAEGRLTNQAFSIDVDDSNGPPVITSQFPEKVPAGVTFAHQIAATDPEGDALIYSIASQASSMSISAAGRVSWPLPQPGTYPVVINVADVRGARARQQIIVRVEGYPEFNTRPVLTATVGERYRYAAVAVDSDGDPVTYSLAQGPSGMAVDAKTGLVEWTPAASGNVTIQLAASDPGGNTGTQSYTLRVSTTPNRAPVFTATPITFVAYPNTYSYTAQATDADGDNLTWSLAKGPAGMAINAVTGAVTWKPSISTAGLFDVEIQVDDRRGGINVQRYVLQVPSFANQAPRISSTPSTQVKAGATYTYGISANDPDGDPLTYALTDGPASMTLTGSGILWQAKDADIGVHPVRLEVSDPAGNVASQSWQIEVTPVSVNRPPAINSIPATTATAGTVYTYQVSASDPDADPLTYALATAPAGMSISASGRVEWAVPQGTAGSIPVEIDVADGRGATVRQSYAIGVGIPANRPPAIGSTPSVTGTAGQTYSYQITASDPDGDPLTYTLAAGEPDMTLSAAGRLEWPIPAGTVGLVDVAVEVSDGRGGVARQAFAIGVGEAGNRAPRITSQAVVSAAAGTIYRYQVSASDPDGDPLAYGFGTAPADMTVSASGLVEWAVPTGVSGLFGVELEVSDGKGGLARQVYAISVPGAGNRAPRIASTPPGTAVVGSSYVYQVSASDPDGDPLSYHLDAAPAGMAISVAGRIEWTPTIAQNGFHDVAVRVADGKGASTVQNFTVHAQLSTNRPPAISSNAVLRATTGVLYTYQVTATDPDNDPLSYSLPTAPAGMTVSATGLVSWNSPAAGNHPVSIRVSDARGAYTLQNYTLAVSGSNQAPVIGSVPPTVVTVGQAYRYEVLATDAEGDFLTYALPTKPTGMTISAAGVIEWAPTSPQTANVTVRVSDGQLSRDQSFTVRVVAAGSEPLAATLSATPPFISAGESTTIQVLPQGGTPPYTVQSFTVDGISRTLDANLQLSIASSILGKHPIRAVLRDSKSASVTVESWFAVADPADADTPVAHISAPGDSSDIVVVDVTAPVDIVGTASDSRLAEYVLLISPAGKDQWTELAKGSSPVTNGVLGRINPQTMANGLYDVGLIARDLSGNEASARITVAVTGDQKTAPLSVTFEDFSYEVEGLPLAVRRTYDSLRRNESLDFGYGWSVDYQDALVQTNGIPGRDWTLVETGSGFNRKLCPRPSGSRVVAIRLPGGALEQFELHAQPECVPLLAWTGSIGITLTPRPGNTSGSTLEALGHSDLRIVGGELFDLGAVDIFNPTQYRLTTRDGTQYTLDRSFGIRQVRDRQGNTLQFTSNGITHSGGWSLAFVRDGKGRITEIRGPGNLHRSYGYDSTGNLVSAAEPSGATATFQYEDARVPHGLTGYSDPAGRLQLKTDYDADGRIIRQTDAAGRAVNIATDTGAKTQTVRDRNGNTTVYSFDARGNITRVVDAAGGITQYEYDAQDNEIAVTDPLGRKTTRTFDAWGNVTSETDPLGRTTLTEYNAKGEVTRTTDLAGRVTTSAYNASGLLNLITNPAGNTIGLGYTGTGSLASLTDALGQQTRFGYGLVNGTTRKLSETAVDGSVTTFGYDAAGRENSTIRPLTLEPGAAPSPASTTRSYDADGNVLSETDAAGHTTTYTYDATGQLIQETDPLARVTRHEYTVRGERSRTLHPDGRIDAWTYDANGNETQACGGNGSLCTATAYDALDRPVRVTDPAGNATVTAYDAVGQITRVTDPRGNATAYTYDAAGRTTSQTDAEGSVQRWSYDAAGNLVEEADARGHVTEHRYNALDQRTGTTLPTGDTFSFAYDALGRRTRDTDAEGHATEYAYDALGRLQSVTDPEGNRTGYAWNQLGQLLAQTDANGHATAYGYDLLGRRTRRTLPDGAEESLAHDPAGKLIAHTDFAGRRTTHAWDAGGKPTQTFRPDGTVTRGYDSYGRLSSFSDTVHGTVSYGLDLLGRTTSLTTNRSGAPGTNYSASLAYQWDGNSNRTRVQISSSTGTPRIDATYDAANRLASLTAPGGGRTTFTYDEAGNRIGVIRSNGSTSEYRYDEANRLVGLTHRRADASVLADFTYTLDANGRRIAIDETVAGQTRRLDYRYDAAGKLVEERLTQAATVRVIAYQYDAVGNRIRKDEAGTLTTYQYDANDRLVSETTGSATTAYAWDANGNLSRRSEPGRTTAYTWNSDNRLTQIDDGARRVQYAYDAEGRRIKRVVTEGATTTETHYVIDSARPYSELSVERTRVNSGAFTEKLYVHTPEGVGDLLAEIAGGTTIHYYPDGQGSTRLVTDEAQAVLETLAFDAFGHRTSGPTSLAHQYTGEYLDAASGFYHLRARDYDPRAGRFVSRDTFEGAGPDPVSRNAYLYASSDPVNHIDPSGYFTLGGMMTGINGIAIQSAVAMVRMEIADMFANALLSPLIDAAVSTYGNGVVPSFGNSGMAGILTAFAAQCRFTKRCFLRKIPTLVNGVQSPMTSKHILDSLMGNGDTIDGIPRPLPFLLMKGPSTPKRGGEVPKGVRDRSAQCDKTAKTAFLGKSACDEYPYASVLQGGGVNYNAGKVSLRLVPFGDNSAHGNRLKQFYRKADVGFGNLFLNLSIPMAPTFFIDNNGRRHFL